LARDISDDAFAPIPVIRPEWCTVDLDLFQGGFDLFLIQTNENQRCHPLFEGKISQQGNSTMTVSGGRLCARRNFESSKLSALIAAATGAPPSAECMSIGRNGGAPYVINVGPLGVSLGVVEHRVAMISISVPADRYVSEAHLIQAFGFSPAEARVAAALARGSGRGTIRSTSDRVSPESGRLKLPQPGENVG
jgi:hypothetical protein